MMAAVPDYLKRRLERGQDLPCVQINEQRKRKRRLGKKRKKRACMATEDDAEKECDEVGKKQEEQDEEREDDIRVAVVKYVVMEGKLTKDLFVELMEMMIPEWDEERGRGIGR